MSDDWLQRVAAQVSAEIATWNVGLQLATPSARQDWLREVERIGAEHSVGDVFLESASHVVEFNPACVRALVEAREAHIAKYTERRRAAIAKLNEELAGTKPAHHPHELT